jgi:hypothetical protein
MVEIVQVQNLLWAASAAGKIVLLTTLAVRKNFRLYPIFSVYLLTSLAHDAVTLTAYRHWGFYSLMAWQISWAWEAIVVCTRALAVTEVCRHLLARYRGVWALAWRLLLASAILVLIISLIIGKHQWDLAVHSASRGLDLAIAAFIAGFFLFIKIYNVETDLTTRILAVGFFLYSCFGALNNTLLEHWLAPYSDLWNILDLLTFLFSLFLWTCAVSLARAAPIRDNVLLPGTVYTTLGSEVNLKLHLLNESLNQFWNRGAPQP